MANKIEISQEILNHIVEQCNLIEFDQCLPPLVDEILSIEGKGIGTNVPYIMAPLFTACGLLLHQTNIASYAKKKTGMSIYANLIGNPGSGKSPAAELIKDGLMKVEKALGIPFDKSAMTNSATVEGLLGHLSKIPCMLAFYDEANTILSSFGRYSGGNGTFDRSIYNTLWSASKYIDRDCKSHRTKLENVRFHMCLLGHPHVLVTMMQSEKIGYDDGLFQRMLNMCPKKPQFKSSVLRNSPQSIQTMHCWFFFMHIVHYEKRRTYSFNAEAQEMLDNMYDQLTDLGDKAVKCDSFLTGTLGKTLTLTCRIACILKSLDVTSKTLVGVIHVNEPELTTAFMTRARELANALPVDAFIIEAEIWLMAKRFVEKCNITKLVLCSYNIDPTGTFDQAFDKIILSKLNVKRSIQLSARFHNYDQKVLRHMRKAFEIHASKMTCTSLGNGNIKKLLSTEVFSNLAALGLGRVEEETNTENNNTCTYFYRIKSSALAENEDLGSIIVDLGLNLQNTIKLLRETEEYEVSDEFNNNTKRIRRPDSLVENQEPANKIRKLSTSSTNLIVKTRNDNGLPFELKNTTKKSKSLTNLQKPNVLSRNSRSLTTFVHDLASDSESEISNIESNQSDSGHGSSESQLNEELVRIGPNEQLLNTQTLIQSSNQVQQSTTETSVNTTEQISIPENENIDNSSASPNSTEQVSIPENENISAESLSEPSLTEIIHEVVDGKNTYWIIVDGVKKRATKNGHIYGSQFSKKQQSESGQTSNSSQSSTTVQNGIVSRHISAVKTRNFKPKHHSTQQKSQNETQQNPTNGWDC